jgi:hypothetical protein
MRKVSGVFFVWIILMSSAGSGHFRTGRDARLLSIVRAQEVNEETSPIYLPLVADQSSNGSTPGFDDSLFGIEFHSAKDWSELQQSSGMNISYTRINGIRWAEIEPVEGERNWSTVALVEENIKTAALNNVRVILVIRHTPGWAQKVPGSPCGPIKEEKLGAFANFVYDVVTRYRSAPYYVKYWEIYNEPDIAPDLLPGSNGLYGCWGDLANEYYGGGYFATMLKSVYPKVKQADPEAQVVVGGMLMSYDPASGVTAPDHEILASKFFEGILANGGGNYFDGVGFHNYDIYMGQLGAYFSRKWASYWNTTGPALIAKAHFLRNLMEDYGISGKFLMNTETALLCGTAQDPPGGPGCESDPESDFEQTKAYYITQSYAAALAEGLRANIWYSLSGWRNSGLVYSDLSPRPAYFSFKFARQKLEDVIFIGAITSQDTGGTDSLLGYKFQYTDGRPIWVIWSKDREESTISLPDPPLGVWDAFGNPVAVPDPDALTVTIKPLFIELSP